MTVRRLLSWLWNGSTLALLAAAFVVHRDAAEDVRRHARATAAAEARNAHRATLQAWAGATAIAVDTGSRFLRAVAPSPADAVRREVATGAVDGTIRFHDGATGTAVRTWPSHHDRAVTALAWVGPVVVSGDTAGAVVVADAKDGAVRWTRHVRQEVVLVLGDEERDAVLAVGRDGQRSRFRLSNGEPLDETAPPPYSIFAFAKDDGEGLVAWAAAGGNLRVWDAWSDGRTGAARFDATHRVDALALDSPRRRAALARRGGVLSVWDTATGALLLEWTEEEPVTSLAFSSDGAVLFAGGVDGGVRSFDSGTGRALGVATARRDQLVTLRAALDGGTLFAGGRRGLLHLLRRGEP